MKTKPSRSMGRTTLIFAMVLSLGDVVAQGGHSNDSCIPYRIGDGQCDRSQNTKACGYDGGDCCVCTCTSGPKFSCGISDFECVDPGASCIQEINGGTSPITECDLGLAADAYCDLVNNNEECGYDGGDCCECTCVSTDVFTCGDGSNGNFACLDPSAPCVDDDDIITLPEDHTFPYSHDPTTFSQTTSDDACITAFFADGDCDLFNNNAECGYDYGDCCECTCISTQIFTCGDESHGGFECLDPDASCVDEDDDITSLESSAALCVYEFFGDGDCDLFNNNEDCGYDEGDCCNCTCIDSAFACGEPSHGGFACVDPNADCVDDDDVTINPSTETTTYYGSITSTFDCIPQFFQDGLCDMINNDESCGYDGGDCCNCTCQSSNFFTCGDEDFGGFACLDPSAPCVDDDDVTTFPDHTTTFPDYTSSLGCNTGWYADGDCDPINNEKDCNYDDGDCCECTCVSTISFTCGAASHGGFNCIDPEASCVDDDDDILFLPGSDDPTYTGSTPPSGCIPEYFSDGLCDLINNIEVCDFDGGDCCECTCESTEEFTCGELGIFECVDPSAPCIADDDIISLESDTDNPTSSCVLDDLSNGVCDPGNNNGECGYDGGDCCECTCTSTLDFTCGDNNGFDCIDPDSSCEEEPVEAGTKTTIGVSTNTYDTRAGEASGSTGCGVDGCRPELTTDGSVGSESRWACAQKLNPGGGLCEIAFVFEDPQDIMEVQVAFYKGDERSRTLQVMVNGQVVGQFDSNPATPYTAFDIQATGVENMTFTTVGLTANDWISLFEVRFMVKP